MSPEQSLGAGTAGVWTWQDARRAGLTEDQVLGRVTRGEWQRLRRGTYLDGGVVAGPLQRASAAVLACGGSGRAVAVGRTAARLWGFPLVDDDDPATGRFEAHVDDVAVTRGRGRTPTLHTRELSLSQAHIVHEQDVPVLRPQRTLLDLACVLRPDALVCALDHALHSGQTTAAELARSATRRAWCPGAPAFRAALELTDAGAESAFETLTRLLLRPVLPGLQSQVRVYGRWGEVIAPLDLADRELRLGVEADGAAYHRGRAAQDRARGLRTGWTIERVTWFQVRCQPEQVLARVLRTAAALRRAAP